MTKEIPQWVLDDLKKEGVDFWRSRFAQESFAKALYLLSAIEFIVNAVEIFELLIEVHGLEEGQRQMNILLEDGAKRLRRRKA